VAGLVEVAGRVLSLRPVATSDVAAGEAHAQVNPAAARAQAFLAPIGGRLDRVDLIQMCAAGGHACTCVWKGDSESKGMGIFMALAPWRPPAANGSAVMGDRIYRTSRNAPQQT
jgi:hypothetical protein